MFPAIHGWVRLSLTKFMEPELHREMLPCERRLFWRWRRLRSNDSVVSAGSCLRCTLVWRTITIVTAAQTSVNSGNVPGGAQVNLGNLPKSQAPSKRSAVNFGSVPSGPATLEFYISRFAAAALVLESLLPHSSENPSCRSRSRVGNRSRPDHACNRRARFSRGHFQRAFWRRKCR